MANDNLPGRARLRCLGALALVALFLGVPPAFAADKPQDVSIQAGPYLLHGCFWTPDGPGPYPVMIFNHGSEKNPEPCGPSDLADFYRRHGFAFFTVQRHGQGASSGPYIMDLQRRAYAERAPGGSGARSQAVALQDLYNKDVEAAVVWLKGQAWADPQRIAMTGISFGGVQTLLTAQKGLGIRAFVAFAPGAQSWTLVLADRLKQAVRQADAPILIVQARNDYSLAPSRVLGPELAEKGAANAVKLYPPFGQTPQDGHWTFGASRDGAAVWGPDVEAFLDRAMR